MSSILGYKVHVINEKLRVSGYWLQHTQQVVNQSVKIYSTAKDIEASSRGFVITKDSTFLAPLYSAGQSALFYTEQLRQLIKDNPAQKPRVDSLKFYLGKLIALSQKAVKTRSEGRTTNAVSDIAGKEGKYYADRVKQITTDIQQQENLLLKQRTKRNDDNLLLLRRFSLMIFILMGVFTILLLIVTGKYLFQNREKKKRAEELVIANKELSFQNTEKGKRAVELDKINNLYAFISQVNQNIVRVKDEETLFKNACSIANEFGYFKIAWIAIFDHEHKKLTCADQAGIAPENLKYFENIPLQANGPQQYVLETSKNYICNDILNAPELKNWRPLAAKQGIRSCMILPIKKSGEVIASFNLYAAELNFFNKAEIELLIEVTDDISFALDLFEKEKSHKRTQELLVQNEKGFRTLIEKSSDMITLTTVEGELIYASNSITAGLGYSVEELLHTSVFDIIHPDDIAEPIENKDKILPNPGRSFYYQQRRLHKNGNWIWCEGTFTNMLHEPGINALVSNFRDISEKKLMQEQQEFDVNNLDALINNTEDLMWSLDSQFNLITSNKPFKKMVHILTGNSVMKGGNVLLAAASIEQGDRYKKNYERAFAGESFTEEEYTPVPVELWSEISYCPIRDGDEVIGTACHSRDITERKKAEETLLLTQFAIDNAGDAVYWMTADARIIRANEAACLMLGYNKQDMLGLSVQDIDPDFNTKKWNIHYKELRRKGSLFFETVQLAKDGRLIPVEIRANYIKFGNAEFNCAFCRDITKRKISEQNLRYSESRLKDAQAIAHIGNFEVSPEDYSEDWSDEMYEIYGVNKDDVIPSKELFLSFIHPDDVAHVTIEMDECLKNFQNSASYFRFIRKDGAMRYGYSEARFESDKNKKLIRIYGILQDVTVSKLADIERIKMVNDLMLRNNDLEQFAYIISHNLRAPVANIIGASNALNDPELSTADKETLSHGLNTSVIKLDNVVKDLNHVLEVKGDINDIKEIVHFSTLTNDIKLSIMNLIVKHDIEIKYDFSEINEFLTLRAYLYSIFFNLISNSVKYRKQLQPCVIEIKSRKDKNKLELTFADNGMGIDLKKNGGQIFGLYRRFHPDIDGKGMGLYMVKTQVETLGGAISIKSAVNEGTEFKIEFAV